MDRRPSERRPVWTAEEKRINKLLADERAPERIKDEIVKRGVQEIRARNKWEATND